MSRFARIVHPLAVVVIAVAVVFAVVGPDERRWFVLYWIVGPFLVLLVAASLVADVRTLVRERREARAAQEQGKDLSTYLEDRRSRRKGDRS